MDLITLERGADRKLSARQWLARGRTLDREITKLTEAYDAEYEKVTSITARIDGDAVSGTKDPHKFERLVELDNLINARIDELVRIKVEILGAINQLQDGRQRLALTSYYIEGKTWEQTAVDMNYSWRHTMNIHKRALAAMEEILKLA